MDENWKLHLVMNNTLNSRDSLMNIVPQFHYALISGPSTGWTTGGTRTCWGQDRQILFEGTERERQGQKNQQQKDDRSPAAASAPDEAKKASPTGSRVAAECVEATKCTVRRSLEGKALPQPVRQEIFVGRAYEGKISCLDLL